jgi:hypothetical protein
MGKGSGDGRAIVPLAGPGVPFGIPAAATSTRSKRRSEHGGDHVGSADLDRGLSASAYRPSAVDAAIALPLTDPSAADTQVQPAAESSGNIAVLTAVPTWLRSLTAHRRCNRAERLIRERLTPDGGIYIYSSTFEDHRSDSPRGVIVTIVARDDLTCARAERLLADVSGLDVDGWASGWKKLDLGDSLIRLYPELSVASAEPAAA